MTNGADKNERAVPDEAEFEASLVSEVDASLAGAETELVEPQPAPEPLGKKPGQPPWVGKVLGHFKLLRLIGEGKMGRVIQAHDVNLHRIVALKVLCKRVPGIDGQKRVNQFLREARAAAQIEHPNVVRIYEINQHDGWWYIAMEMLEGGNLREVIRAAGPLSTRRACAFIADAAAALAVAHDVGIIHRDIKPTNLMLSRHGRCKLTDFGLVRLDDPNDPFDFTHKAVGSPLFMAPEMILRKEQTPAIDVYSLGTTLYYALTGRAPFTGKSIDEVLKRHVRETAPDIRTLLPDCSPSLASLIGRALAKDPIDRPSAADMAAALRAEAIATGIEDSGTLSPGASSLLRELAGSGAGEISIRTQPTAIGRYWPKIQQVIQTRRFLIPAVLIALAAGVALLAFYAPGVGLRARRTRLSRYFPNAPPSYGVLPRSVRLKPIKPSSDEPPAFSWVHKSAPADWQFVASSSGGRFWPVDAPEATLIRSEDVVRYKTAEDALADGKVAAR